MKSSIKKDTFERIYRQLDKVTPLKTDCGLLCGAACCSCTDGDLGIYLLPGEEKVFTRREKQFSWEKLRAHEYEFPDSWHGKIWFLRCNTAPLCDRGLRPLQCRFFPLTPHLDEENRLYMIYHSGALPYECPLITEKQKLDDDFIKVCYDAWHILISDRLIFDLVKMDSQNRIKDNEPIDAVFPAIP